MPFSMTIGTPEKLDFALQIIGGGVVLFLIKWGLRERRRKSIESLGLMDKNVLWAQDMMDRLKKQIDDLQDRVLELERENRKLSKAVENYRLENFLLERRILDLQNAKTETGT